jgi:mRNA-degrading endonuclease RelE of RelBE toxin-antitoxin system
VRVIYSDEAQEFLNSLPANVSNYIQRAVSSLAEIANQQMLVRGMTLDQPDHIYRAMKIFGGTPSVRVIFYLLSKDAIYVVRIARRDEDPYRDGY